MQTAEANFLSGDERTVTMRVVGIGITRYEAIFQAEKNAFNVLFFRGLPESQQKIPLISTNETSEINQHETYFEHFFLDKRHKSFIMSSVPVTEFTRYKCIYKHVAVDIRINLDALRRDLENNGIIRKFGY